jgi:hypothetical protein
MTKTRGIEFQGRFFWAYDVVSGVFLKYLIDEAESSEHANEPWLLKAVTHWRVQAALAECGLTLEEEWSSEQRQVFIKLAEAACEKIGTRDSIPAGEVESWPLKDDLRICSRGEYEISTAPVIEFGYALVALVSGKLERAPNGKAWFYGKPEGRSTIDMGKIDGLEY